MVVRLAGGVHVSAELGIEELRVVRPILWRNRPAPQPEADSVLMPRMCISVIFTSHILRI